MLDESHLRDKTEKKEFNDSDSVGLAQGAKYDVKREREAATRRRMKVISRDMCSRRVHVLAFLMHRVRPAMSKSRELAT